MTGDKKVAFYTKKIFGLTEIRDWFLGYLDKLVRDFTAHVWGVPGFFTATDIDITTADELSLTVAPHAADGSGNLIEATDSDDYEHLPFENTLGTTYHVGVSRALRAYGIEKNPRTGEVEYRAVEEVVGKSGAPDSVTDLGGTIELVIDGICDAGVSQEGRRVLVYLVSPESGILAEAIEECVVVWDSGVNKVITAGDLGQSSVSTTAADYTVVLLGTLITTRDLRLDSSVAYVGSVVGAGAGNPPASKDTSEQRVFHVGGVGVLSDILELCAHGFTKIRVKAFPGDPATEPQIAVKNVALGTDTFWVDKAGDVTLGNKVTALGTMSLDDVNLTASIPVSSASDTALPVGGPANVVASLKAAFETTQGVGALLGHRVLDGFEITDGGGLVANYALGQEVLNGKLMTVSAGTIILTGSTTQWLYLNALGAVAKTTTFPSSLFRGTILARVTTGVGTITEIVDMRLKAHDLVTTLDLTVGGRGQYETLREALAAIGEYATKWPFSMAPYSWRLLVLGKVTETDTITFPVGGVTIEAKALDTEILLTGKKALFELGGMDNLKFRGLKMKLDPGSAVGGGDPLTVAFSMSGTGSCAGLEIEGCRLTNGSAVVGRTVQGFFVNQGTGTLTRSRIANNEAVGMLDCGIVTGEGSDVLVEGNRITHSGTSVGSLFGGVRADTQERLIVRGNWLIGWETFGVYLIDPEKATVSENHVELDAPSGGGIVASAVDAQTRTDVLIQGNEVHLTATAAGVDHTAISVSGAGCRVIGNRVTSGPGGNATTSVTGILFNDSEDSLAIGNNFRDMDTTGGITAVGVEINGTSPTRGDRILVLGNVMGGSSIIDGGADTLIIHNLGIDQAVPIVWEAPGTISATMAGGSGTGSYTLQAGTTRWRGSINTDGNWSSGGTITLTITAPGTTAKSGWRCNSLRGAVRYSTISVAPDTITIVMNNISGGTIPAGTAVTVGLLAYEGEEP